LKEKSRDRDWGKRNFKNLKIKFANNKKVSTFAIPNRTGKKERPGGKKLKAIFNYKN